MKARLHVRLYVDGVVVVDDDIDVDNAFDRAESHARTALQAGRRWRLEISDPDEVLPTVVFGP